KWRAAGDVAVLGLNPTHETASPHGSRLDGRVRREHRRAGNTGAVWQILQVTVATTRYREHHAFGRRHPHQVRGGAVAESVAPFVGCRIPCCGNQGGIVRPQVQVVELIEDL